MIRIAYEQADAIAVLLAAFNGRIGEANEIILRRRVLLLRRAIAISAVFTAVHARPLHHRPARSHATHAAGARHAAFAPHSRAHHRPSTAVPAGGVAGHAAAHAGP